MPFRAPYLPPEYEKLWGKTRNLKLYSVLEPIRRLRDKRMFIRHVRDSDIFIVGHPKSGNTWMAYILAVILSKDFEKRVTMRNVGEYVPVIHGQDSKVSAYPDLPDPRVFRTEWPLYGDHYPRVIYLIRDPRAVLVSYFHMYRIFFGDMTRTLEDFVEEYLSFGCIRKWEPLVRWDIQVLDWKERAAKDSSVLIMKYEDMVTKRKEALRRLVQHANIPCDEVTLSLAEARGDFESMKLDEEKHGAESYPGEIGKRGRFLRRGRVDGWRDELPEHLVCLIENEFRVAMEASGYL